MPRSCLLPLVANYIITAFNTCTVSAHGRAGSGQVKVRIIEVVKQYFLDGKSLSQCSFAVNLVAYTVNDTDIKQIQSEQASHVSSLG